MTKSLKLEIENLPLMLEVLVNGKITSVYLIKKNKEKTGVFLNKAENL